MGCVRYVRPSTEARQSCLVKGKVVDLTRLAGGVLLSGRLVVLMPLGVPLCGEEGRAEGILERSVVLVQ